MVSCPFGIWNTEIWYQGAHKVKLRPLFENETNVSSFNPSSETWALLSFNGDLLFRYQILNYLNPSQYAVPSSPQPNDACPEF